MPRLSVVIPCYNEEDCLVELLQRVTAACRSITEDYELVLVNDGSQDSTWTLIQDFASEDSRIVGVDLSRNHGHQLALTAGLTLARGDRILIIDADLQDPPELLGPMMERIDGGYDVVYGQRRQRSGETLFKKSSARLFYRLLLRLSETPIPLDTGDFRLMSRRALDALLAMPEQHRFVRGMVSWIGFPQTALLYDRDERFAGTTKYPLKKMIRFAVDAITGFSIQPLRFASQIGLLLAGLGALLIAYTLIGWFSGATVAGWTSLMAVVVVLGSVQMFVLGFIGEYLGRLYMQAKQRPLFFVQGIACQTKIETSGAERLGFVAAGAEEPHPAVLSFEESSTRGQAQVG